MKKFLWLMILAITLGYSQPAFARTKSNDNERSGNTVGSSNASVAIPSPTLPKPSDAQKEEMRKKLEEKKKELNGSEWKVTLKTGKEEINDVLSFQNNQVNSKEFLDKGFPASNYTVSIADGSDMATWETMKTNPKGGVVFMRGEWNEKVMRGVISEPLEEGKSKDYNFASTAAKVEIPASTEKVEKIEEKAPETAVLESKEVAAEAGAEKVLPFNPGTTDEESKKS